MKQSQILSGFFLLNTLFDLTSTLPYQHLVIFDPDVVLVPQETVVSTQLQVSPRVDGTGEYEFKEVPVISRARSMELLPAEEELVESEGGISEKIQKEERVKGEVILMMEADAKDANLADEAVKTTVKELDENSKSLSDNEDSPQSVVTAVIKPPKLKRTPIIDSGNPIYITIPIYVNSSPGMPLQLSVGSQEVAIKGNNRQRPASRRGILQKEGLPTSQYNKLLV